MDPDRRARLWSLVVEAAGERPVAIEQVCGVMVSVSGVDAVAVTVTLSASLRETLYSTDQIAEELEELTLTLGEGPGVDALTDGPALVEDLLAPESVARWPVFAPAAVEAGVRAMFALPLRVGGIRLGVVDLYRAKPGPLDKVQLSDILMLADTACALLLDGARDYQDGNGPEHPGHQHPVVHQATGMVLVQLGVTAAIALIRLRAYAYANDLHLHDVAADVVANRLRFHPDQSGGG
jgi:GAF domain-containing protein